MGFNSAFKGLICETPSFKPTQNSCKTKAMYFSRCFGDEKKTGRQKILNLAAADIPRI